MMRHLSTAIELLGLAVLVWGVALFDTRAALIVGGLLVALVGYALDPPAGGPEQ